MLLVICGVGEIPLVELMCSFFPTERCLLSCFQFNLWKDWCCKCEDFDVVYLTEDFPLNGTVRGVMKACPH